METKKVALACFIGGALCTLIALLFSPQYWLLGLAAGISAGLISGYLSYDFREMIRIIPLVAKETWGEIWEALNSTGRFFRNLGKAFWWLITKPHPFIHTSMALTILVLLGLNISAPRSISTSDYVATYVVLSFGALVGLALSLLLIPIISSLGLNVLKKDWDMKWEKWQLVYFVNQDPTRQGETLITPRYYLVTCCFLWGCLVLVAMTGKNLWKMTKIPRKFLAGIPKFVKNVFILIHTQLRILCAIDGTFGGVIALIMFRSAELSLAGYVCMICFGGLLGTAFGVLNWEIVSKRLLKIPVAINS